MAGQGPIDSLLGIGDHNNAKGGVLEDRPEKLSSNAKSAHRWICDLTAALQFIVAGGASTGVEAFGHHVSFFLAGLGQY